MQNPELEELKVIGRKLDRVIALLEAIAEHQRTLSFTPAIKQDSRSEQSNHATFHGALKGAMAVCNCRQFKSGDKWECPYHGYIR